jgi:hypothetical protein
MRKFTCAALLLIVASACKKSTQSHPDAAASFQRVVNGTDFYSYDFSSATSTNLTFTQTYYTGSATNGKQTRWSLSLADAMTPVNFTFSFPGIDSSLTLPTGNDMTFAYPLSPLVSCSLDDKGTLYLGTDSTFMDITILSLTNNLVSGTFAIQLYGSTGTCMINNGHFANIPIVYTSQ